MISIFVVVVVNRLLTYVFMWQKKNAGSHWPRLISSNFCDDCCFHIHFHFHFQYNPKDEVVLWMNTVGPYDNRQETYAYFSLPFCQGTKHSIGHYHETLSEALQGVELEHSGYAIDFRGEY